MRGVVVFYINFFPELGQNQEEILTMMRNFNAPVIERIEKEGYSCMFLATTKEAARVEKIDFDKPFPRYVLPRMDITENDEIVNTIKHKMTDEDGK